MRRTVKWLGTHLYVTGSPYHPRVVDPRKVYVDGGWHSHLDRDERLDMKINQTKKLLFDVTGAGPGKNSDHSNSALI